MARSRTLRLLVWLVLFVLALVVALWLNETRAGRGVLLVICFVTIVGGAVAWLSSRGSRLSSSGRDPSDMRDARGADRHHQGPGF